MPYFVLTRAMTGCDGLGMDLILVVNEAKSREVVLHAMNDPRDDLMHEQNRGFLNTKRRQF